MREATATRALELAVERLTREHGLIMATGGARRPLVWRLGYSASPRPPHALPDRVRHQGVHLDAAGRDAGAGAHEARTRRPLPVLQLVCRLTERTDGVWHAR